MSKFAKDLIEGMTEAVAYADGNGTDATVQVTKSFKDLVQSRAARDPAFAAALLQENIHLMPGDVDTGTECSGMRRE